LKIGVALPNVGATTSKKGVEEVALLAEKLGFDSIWTADHLLVGRDYASTYGMTLESLATLSYLSGKTERVHLGTGVLVLPMREVVLLAKQITAIQVLSNNRLLLGVGAGWNEAEFANVNAESFSDRGMYFDEALQLIKWLLKGNAGFTGEFYKIKDGVFGPIPKKPIPIYIGGNSGQSLRRAAKLGDGWLPIGISVHDFKENKLKLEKLAQKRMELLLRMTVVFSEKEKGLPKQTTGSSGGMNTRLAGTPNEILSQIIDYKRAGVNHLICYFGDREPRILKVKIEEFASKILTSI
jgi:probable F420-dependent oxidoreductase